MNKTRRSSKPTCLLLIVILIAALCYQEYRHRQEWKKAENATIILISKQDMTLRLIDYKGKIVFSAPVAVGRNSGDKQTHGDYRTPEGIFLVSDIQRSSDWKHDFGDGKGKISGAYGDYFIRLSVPGHHGIGIHGTHLPETIGTRASEGCIRMKNEDLNKLIELIYPPMTVIITPAAEDETENLKTKD